MRSAFDILVLLHPFTGNTPIPRIRIEFSFETVMDRHVNARQFKFGPFGADDFRHSHSRECEKHVCALNAFRRV